MRSSEPAPRELAQLLPELRELLPDLPKPPLLDPEAARFRLFDAVSSFLTRAAAKRPIVLVLDDLHAADEPSLLLLQFVARGLGDSRLLVVGAYRDVDPTLRDPLASTLAELGRERTTRRIALGGFAEPDVGEYVSLDRRHRGGPGNRRGDPRSDGGKRAVRRRGDATADRGGRARGRSGGKRGHPAGRPRRDRSPDSPAVRAVRANADDGLRAGARVRDRHLGANDRPRAARGAPAPRRGSRGPRRGRGSRGAGQASVLPRARAGHPLRRADAGAEAAPTRTGRRGDRSPLGRQRGAASGGARLSLR